MVLVIGEVSTPPEMSREKYSPFQVRTENTNSSAADAGSCAESEKPSVGHEAASKHRRMERDIKIIPSEASSNIQGALYPQNVFVVEITVVVYQPLLKGTRVGFRKTIK